MTEVRNQRSEINARLAVGSDISDVVKLDTYAQENSRRVAEIQSWVLKGQCYVALSVNNIVGYGVLTYTFFHHGQIEMLMVDEAFRQQGIGRLLVRHIAAQSKTEKFFVTTNLSNYRMQKLLKSEGFVLSGYVDNLDDNDPELVFFKPLSQT